MWLAAYHKAFFDKAYMFFANIQQLEKVKSKFPHNVQIVGYMFIAGVVCIFFKGDIKMPVIAFNHPMASYGS